MRRRRNTLCLSRAGVDLNLAVFRGVLASGNALRVRVSVS